jgi:hypothetical protein
MEAPPVSRSRELSTVLANLATDAAAVEVIRALTDEGIEAILLKGPALDRLLYDRRGERSYGDVDLLVAPAEFADAERILARLGFRSDVEESGLARTDHHADMWLRPGDGAKVDLHRTLVGVRATEWRTWDELRRATRPLDLGSFQATVLDETGSALVVALHTAHHGPRKPEPIQDLDRALERLERPAWADAAQLAERLDAVFAFAAGLRRRPAGAVIADELGLPRHFPVDTALRVSQSRRMSLELEAVAAAGGLRAKLNLVRALLFPTRRHMRAWYPLARRGTAGLAAAYVGRLLRIPVSIAPALMSSWRARRQARRHGLS